MVYDLSQYEQYMERYHMPVLLDEAIEALSVKPTGTYVDLTYGGGGHSKKILELLTQGHLYAFDRDQDAKNQAKLCTHQKMTFIQAPFQYAELFLRFYGVDQVDGILADLGLSSYQIDQPVRGFSIRHDSPLDMRMDRRQDLTAKEIINSYSKDHIASIISHYGEIPQAQAVAELIVARRDKHTIDTTFDLIKTVEPFIPKYRPQQYLAKLFQAFRIEVNGELKALETMLNMSADIIAPGGKLVVISYHSLEDRLVKRYFKTGNTEGYIIQDAYGNLIRPFAQAHLQVPSPNEIGQNPRARSAKLRVATKV